MGAVDNPAVFASRVLIALGLTALVILLITFLGLMLEVLMLAFAAILVTVAVDGLTRVVQRYTPLGRGLSLTAAFLLILLSIGGLTGLIYPQAAEQIPRLAEKLPAATQEILQQMPFAREVEEEIEARLENDNDNGTGLFDDDILTQALGIFSTTLGAIGSFFIILLLAVYLVLNPGVYLGHLLQLLPVARRTRVAHMFNLQGKALRLWLLGRLVSMVFVGVTSAIGLLLLGVPMALTLGLIAGLATFIPYLGPILGAIPAVLVAFLVSPQIGLYVAILYFVIESVESALIYPLAQRHVVHIPPAYTVLIQIGGGVLGGLPGVILATPLAVVAAVAIQMLYVEDVLGESVEVLGDQ